MYMRVANKKDLIDYVSRSTAARYLTFITRDVRDCDRTMKKKVVEMGTKESG